MDNFFPFLDLELFGATVGCYNFKLIKIKPTAQVFE